MSKMFLEPLILADDEFALLQSLIKKRIGVNLTDAKRSLIISRLSKHIRMLGLRSFREYIERVENDSEELQCLYNRITTNVTNFFREKHHFDHLRDVCIPELIASGSHKKVIRIWCAACSTGEEAYSIAISCNEILQEYPGWHFEILASDINTDALNKAKNGIYEREEVMGISYPWLTKYFKLGVNENSGKFKIKDFLKQTITFRQINLVSDQPYPIMEPLHIIFCRNVFIYFDKMTQKQIIDRFVPIISDQGYLILGHSESINSFNSTHPWIFRGQTVYQKD